MTACASSASLVRAGRFAEACRKFADDSRENRPVFQEPVFARLAPRLALATADANTASEPRELVSSRFAAPRFVHIAFAQDPSAPFEAHMTLEGVRDRRAYYRAGDAADAYFAADLVTPQRKGTLAELFAVGKLLIGGAVLLTSVTLCSVARAIGASAAACGFASPARVSTERTRWVFVTARSSKPRRGRRGMSAPAGARPE